MKLIELTTKLQNLCHNGYSLDDVYIDIDGHNTNLCDIEVRKVEILGDLKHYMITLVAWKK